MPICVLYNFLVRPSRSYGARRANSLRARRKSTVIATLGRLKVGQHQAVE